MDEIKLANSMIDALGGTGKAAAIFNLTDAAISQWRVRGMPVTYVELTKYKRPKIYKQVMSAINLKDADNG